MKLSQRSWPKVGDDIPYQSPLPGQESREPSPLVGGQCRQRDLDAASGRVPTGISLSGLGQRGGGTHPPQAMIDDTKGVTRRGREILERAVDHVGRLR